MIADSIEREVQIDAPIERVWAIVTEPQHLSSWLGGGTAEVDLRPGGELVIRFGETDAANGTVEKVERPSLFAFRWVTPEAEREPGLGMDHATLVEFQLRAEGDGTTLRLVESGFAALGEEGAMLLERHNGGWPTFMDQLVAYAASAEVAA